MEARLESLIENAGDERMRKRGWRVDVGLKSQIEYAGFEKMGTGRQIRRLHCNRRLKRKEWGEKGRGWREDSNRRLKTQGRRG